MLLAALVLPQIAYAECPPPKTPATGEQFSYCFDPSRLGPQSIVDADKGPMLVIEVELNGHKLPALLDTGAESSVVDIAAAKELGLKIGVATEITASDGRKTGAFKAPINTLVIGGLTRTGGFVLVSDLSAPRREAAQPFAMVVGADLLAQVALGVNRDKQALIVMPSNAHVTGGSGWMAPLHLQQPGNIFTTDLSIDGHSVTVRIDTGLENELILHEPKWAEIVPPKAQVTTFIGFGAAGSYVEPMVRLEDVKIGDESIGDTIAERVAGAIPTDGSDGELGMGILSRFNFFLNPKAGVMFISRPQKAVPPRRETMVGILGSPTDSGITVMHVMADSPAEAAGLKAGDRICTVDGEKVSAAWVGTAKNDWMTGPEGKTVTLGRCSGGTVRVTLRRFY